MVDQGSDPSGRIEWSKGDWWDVCDGTWVTRMGFVIPNKIKFLNTNTDILITDISKTFLIFFC